MDIKIRCAGLGTRAADNSIIPEPTVREYLESEEYKSAVENRTMLGYLTHRARGVEGLPSSAGDSAVIRKKIGSDDSGYIVADGVACFTHYVKRFYIEETPRGNFLSAEVHIFDPNDFDELAAENIKRLRGLIVSGVKCYCSLIVLGYWSGDNGNGADYCKKIKSIKGLDFTQNPSFGITSHITEVIYSDEEKEQMKDRTFSNIEEDESVVKVKTFSKISDAGFDVSSTPKTSKIDGQFTKLKVKEFSFYSIIKTEDEPEEKTFAQPKTKEETPEQKNFTVAGIRDQLRERKLGVRLMFRRMILSYKQVVKSMGSNMKPEDEAILKSMLSSDVLYVLNKISDEVITKNKQINTLLGASSISKSLRLACTDLQLSYRMAGMEVRKQGFVSKIRYQRLSAAYNKFVGAVLDEVFKNTDNMPKEEDDKVEEGK